MKYEPNQSTPLITTIAVVLVLTALALLGIQLYEHGVFTKDGITIEMNQESGTTDQRVSNEPNPTPLPQDCPEGTVADTVPALVSDSEVLMAVYERVLQYVAQHPCDFLPNQPEANIESRVLQIDADGWGIAVDTTDAFNVKMRLRQFSDSSSEINEEVLSSLETMTREVLQQFGFVAASPTAFDQGYTQDFKKSDERCVLEVPRWEISTAEGEEFHTDFVLNCFTDATFEEARQAQLPFLKGIGEKGVFLLDIKRVADDKATMRITEGLAGGRAWMYKENGEWKTVAKWLQAVPACSEMAGVPEKYWIDCYESESSDTIREGSFNE